MPPSGARAIDYRNAGTFEFLLGPDGAFYFIELNARLQVEHPVSELVTGIDLVREQLRSRPASAAATGRAERRGHAIEIRINAEDPTATSSRARGGSSASGRRSAPACGSTPTSRTAPSIPPNYDSLLAKVIVWDADRPAAIDRALRALSSSRSSGVPTTTAAARDILRTEEFATGRYSTGFLEEAGRRLPALGG